MRSLIGAVVALAAMLAFSADAIAIRQPHMEATLESLEAALHEIEIADQFRDHGGHAANATELIRRAIHEVREGIRYRDMHGP